MRVSAFKIDPNWDEWFALITRGFLTEFAFAMSRNAWVLYLTLATFYNRRQARAFPTLERIETVCPLGRFSRSRALRELRKLGLVEVWAERRGRRRRTFYRLLHADAKGHHKAQLQQATCEEIFERAVKGVLPPGYEWVQRAHLKSGRSVCVCQ